MTLVGRRTVLAGVGGALAAPGLVSAQGTYPNKTVRYINPFPAGGATDTLSRIFCVKMAELSGQQWVVENKGGSGGNVGMDALAELSKNALESEDIKAKFIDLAATAIWRSPADTLAYRNSEEARLAPIIKASGARVD